MARPKTWATSPETLAHSIWSMVVQKTRLRECIYVHTYMSVYTNISPFLNAKRRHLNLHNSHFIELGNLQWILGSCISCPESNSSGFPFITWHFPIQVLDIFSINSRTFLPLCSKCFWPLNLHTRIYVHMYVCTH